MAGQDGHIRVLQQELGRLQNAVTHLVTSNAELKEALAAEGDDDDRTYKTAIEDNIVTIAKYRAQAERLEKELRELLQGRQPLDAHAVPTEEATAAAGGGQQQGGTGGGDAPMAEVAGQPQQQQQQQQQPNSGGMWM